MVQPSPIVSVVISTYNRSGVLRCAVESALSSSLDDLEVIVVGDHCTDDTAEVVAGIDDPRVRFVNLPEHTGDQSAANNHGVRIARARLIAFLNHDDLFFPDHLRVAVERLESNGADFLWTPTLIVEPTTERDLRRRKWSVRIGSTALNGQYDPLSSNPASSWVVRKDLIDRVGPWRPAGDLRVFPSHDWIFRAWRAGAKMFHHPHPRVVVFQAGTRKNAYLHRHSAEHEFFSREARENPRFREELLESAAVGQAAEAARITAGRYVVSVIDTLASRLLELCAQHGVHPKAVSATLLYGKGGATRRHRRIVGLGPLSGPRWAMPSLVPRSRPDDPAAPRGSAS